MFGLLEILGQKKQWQCCRSIFISRTFNTMLGSTSNPTLPAPLPNLLSRSKPCILLCLLLVGPGNPSPWITCQAFLLLGMETTTFLWSLTDSLRFRFWRFARRVSQLKTLLSSSLNECGYILGSHSSLSQIGIADSLINIGQAYGRCWIPSSLSP